MAAHIDDTAIALLALRDREQHPVVQSALQYLERVAPALAAPWSRAQAISLSLLHTEQATAADRTFPTEDFRISQVSKNGQRWL